MYLHYFYIYIIIQILLYNYDVYLMMKIFILLIKNY